MRKDTLGLARISLYTWLSICLLALGVACRGGGDETPPPAPTVTSFVAAKSPMTAGTATTLTAVFSNGTASIDHGVGTVTSGTPISISPTADTTYTLTVTGPGGTVTRTVTVQVVAPPSIGAFGATPSTITLGGTSVLACTFSGGTGVIEPGAAAVVSGGTKNVSPTATTTYTLTVTNAAGTAVTATTTVTVVPPPSITSFTNSGPVTSGSSALLTAVFSGGSATVDQGLGPIVSGVGLPTGTLTATTTYTLTVTNAAGTAVTATTTVTVVPPPIITSFTNDGPVTSGNAALLTAVFSGGSATVDHGLGPIVSGVGLFTGSLAASTTYTLTVTNAAGTAVTATTSVTVVPPPIITSFTSNSPVAIGSPATLTAVFSGGSATVDQGLGPIVSGVGLSTGNLTVPTTFTLTVANAAGTVVTATTTVSIAGDLAVTIDGLATLPADVTITGPDGYSQHLTATQTLSGLEPGTYTISAATVADASQPGLGRANGGTLGPDHLQRYPLKSLQTVTVDGGSTASATVVYPAAVLTLQIPTLEDPDVKVPMDLVLVPGGGFTMGSNEPADWDALNTNPPHTVTLGEAFYVARTELTQAQWKAIMGATNNPSNFRGEAFPVEQVSWNALRAATTGFLDRLNAALPGLGLRLPTEAEWEYTCRSGTTTAYFFGADATDLSIYSVTNVAITDNVASKAPNAWGLFDTAGNVREWLEDDSHDGYAGAPVDGSAWVDSPRGVNRVLRGGGWDGIYGASYARSAYRDDAEPSVYWSNVGFRLVMPVPAP